MPKRNGQTFLVSLVEPVAYLKSELNAELAPVVAWDGDRVRATIETSRLILRPFESSDAEVAFAWFGDPIVMRFTPTGPDTSLTRRRSG